MRNGEFLPCLPTRATKVPAGPDWLHEIKHDGYRLIVQRDGKRVRLFTRSGLDWTKRYPWIVETALRMKQSRFTIDGEAVVLGVDGVSDFNALHSRQYDDEVQLYAFDILAYEGDDLTRMPLHLRKTNLDQLLRGRPNGIFVAPFEQGAIGPLLFEAACKKKLEGIVPKHRERPYPGSHTSVAVGQARRLPANRGLWPRVIASRLSAAPIKPRPN
jgi:bifunctional non-homologous end joining protein LigD